MSKAEKTSAGLILYRIRADQLEVLIGHMGGPFWAKKDAAGWSIPKGEIDAGEDPWLAARREFAEETGHPAPDGPPLALGEVRQSNGKRIVAWAVEGDLDPRSVKSNTFAMEWPPRSGRQAEFPEIDRAAWVDPGTAREKLVRGQIPLIDSLEEQVSQARRERPPRSSGTAGSCRS